MILAFCIKGGDHPLPLDDRFGRSDKFCIVDSHSGNHIKLIENKMKDLSGSAGVGAVQSLFEEGVEGIIAPALGPTAEDARNRLDIKLWDQGDCKTVEDALLSWQNGDLEAISRGQQPEGLYRP